MLLLAIAFILGILSFKNTREIIADDFQQQQLILARTAARQMEEGLEFLRRELRILAYSPAVQYLEDVAWSNRMRVSFDDISKMGVAAIVRIDFVGPQAQALRAFVVDRDAPRIVDQDFNQSPEVIWARDPANRRRIYQSPIEVEQQAGLRVPYMKIAMPVYEDSVDESHPKPLGKLDGVLLFRLDASKFAGHYCANIRSGRTGYCWVLNRDGMFLHHPEREFIGEDAFLARGRRNPVISFDRINEIQKANMLAGEEGTSQYISGWHRGVIRKMDKFLAYSRAKIEPAGSHIWPVAVVAPTDEVWGTIQSLYIRQFLIQGLLIFAFVCAAVAVIYYERRWTAELEMEVGRTTADLKRSREQYKSVVENARDFIFTLDEYGTFVGANTSMARALGIPARGLINKKVSEVFSPEDAQALMETAEQVFETGKNVEIKSAFQLRGRVFWLSTHFLPIFGADGRLVERVLVMARDITDRQHMEEQLAQTEKLASLGTLAAGVAHEINNPLGVMLGFAELLVDQLPPGSKQQEMLKTIERQGLNCKKIVENLMTFARAPAKHEEFTEINQDIENVVNLIKNTLLTKKIELEVRLGKKLPPVRGDACELQQVFLNLVNNAAAAMSGGGKITVITKTNHYTHMVEAIFADTGAGIPKEIADRVFDPFFTTKKAGEGTGLGLAVSYAIINKYGGSIRFETRTTGDKGGNPSGTTFFVSLAPYLGNIDATSGEDLAKKDIRHGIHFGSG